jgi:hypothetical protein
MPDDGRGRLMAQAAPYPEILKSLVARCEYREGWRLMLGHVDRGQGSVGLTLSILIEAPDTYDPEQDIRVIHYFIVPAANYDERSWQRWLFDQLLLVERHEACEFFQIDGERPYAPNHGPGNDPYIIFDHATLQEARTDHRGNKRDTDAPD